MAIDFKDVDGRTVRECRDAMAAVHQALVKDLTTLPPYLGIQLTTIRDCLGVVLKIAESRGWPDDFRMRL